LAGCATGSALKPGPAGLSSPQISLKSDASKRASSPSQLTMTLSRSPGRALIRSA
jgi:hypothetical protein